MRVRSLSVSETKYIFTIFAYAANADLRPVKKQCNLPILFSTNVPSRDRKMKYVFCPEYTSHEKVFHPAHLLRVSLLRVLGSNFLGNSL